MKIKKTLLYTLIIAFLCCPLISCEEQTQKYEKVKIIKVVDGDTVYVSFDDKSEYKLRMIGIDTPESTISHEPYGKEASEFTKKMLLGKTVYLESDVSETDKYGRILRYIWMERPENKSKNEIKEKMFNAVLVLEGYANAATFPPDVKYSKLFVELQDGARNNKKGLWNIEATDEKKEIKYIGNKNTKKYHVPTCRFANEISEQNKVFFESKDEAISKGYSPCKNCIK